MIRIATFNCEWRRTGSRDAGIVRDRVLGGGADVVCLTETHADFFGSDGYTIESTPDPDTRIASTRRKVLLWSRNPWTAVEREGPDDFPKGRFASGTTETPLGELRFVGVVIPYNFAGIRFIEPKKAWEVHLDYLTALDRYLPAQPDRTVVLGDFNQRVPRKHQPRHVYDAFDRTLLGRFDIATAGLLPGIDRQAIDHVCLSRDLAADGVTGLSNLRPGGGQICDHFGVRVLVRPRPRTA